LAASEFDVRADIAGRFRRPEVNPQGYLGRHVYFLRDDIDGLDMMRMLIIGYCFGIRSERRLCEEVHLDLAYRWFCRLGLDGDGPDHSAISKNRRGRLRGSDLLRKLSETVVARCIKEAVGGRSVRGRRQHDRG
jgi:hypothetical protein